MLLVWLCHNGSLIYGGEDHDASAKVFKTAILQHDGSINTAAVRRIEAELAKYEKPKVVREEAYSEVAGRTKRRLTLWDQLIIGRTDPLISTLKGIVVRTRRVDTGVTVFALASSEDATPSKGHLCWFAYSRQWTILSTDWLWVPQEKAVYLVLVRWSDSRTEGTSVEFHRVDPNHAILPLPMDFAKIPEAKWPEEPKPVTRYVKYIVSEDPDYTLINGIRVKLEERRLVVDTYYNDKLKTVVFTFDLKTRQWSAKGSDNVRFEDVQPPE